MANITKHEAYLLHNDIKQIITTIRDRDLRNSHRLNISDLKKYIFYVFNCL